jgi:Holliday junction resolvasome RuvABC ATP-dependent DNA helicase subunit
VGVRVKVFTLTGNTIAQGAISSGLGTLFGIWNTNLE